MANLVSFAKVKSEARSYENALLAYSRFRSEEYSKEKAFGSASSRVLEARWVAYKGKGITLTPKDILLIFFGRFGFTEKQLVVDYKTFHAIDENRPPRRTSLLLRGFLIEAVAIVVGLLAFTIFLFGILTFIMSGLEFLPISARIGIVAIGIAGFFGFRALLRHARAVRIPYSYLRDSTSPFYLIGTTIHPARDQQDSAHQSTTRSESKFS